MQLVQYDEGNGKRRESINCVRDRLRGEYQAESNTASFYTIRVWVVLRVIPTCLYE